MLEELLSGEKIDNRNSNIFLSFVLRLENAFILEKDKGRSEEFERPSTHVNILYRKLPYLADRLAEQKAKQVLKTGENQTFQNFME
jgi:hypothetical protein